MIENQTQEVKKQNIEPTEDDFKKGFKICQTIFYDEIYYNNKFNSIAYNSIESTVRVIIEKYGIEAILYFEFLTTNEYSNFYGTQKFHPKALLDLINSKQPEIEKFKNNLKKKNELNILEIKKSDEDKITVPLYSLIPDMSDNTKRTIPNVFLRSALFGVIKQGRRQYVKDVKIHTLSQYEISYTGEQLDQNDLELWDSLTYLAKDKKTEYDLKISMYELCKIMEYSQSKTNRDRIKSRINRLQICQIKIKYGKGLYAGSLVDDYYINDDDGKVVLRLNSRFLNLFSSNDYTRINRNIRKELGENQLASWLYHFYETHSDPIDYTIEYLRNLSGSCSNQKEFNRMIKNALLIIKNAYYKNKHNFDYDIQDGKLSITKNRKDNKTIN